MKLKLSLLSLIAIIALNGCGSSNEDDTNTSNGSTNSNPSEEATALPSGEVRSFEEAHIGIEDNLNIDEENREDWFEIELDADNYTIYSELLTGTDGSGSMTITVYNPKGVSILELDSSGRADSWKRDSFVAEKDGVYKIKVASRSSKDIVYNFSLFHSIAGGLVQDTQNERNDNKQMATPITFEQAHQKVTGNLNISRVSDNEDWYSMELTPDNYTLYANLLTGTEYEHNIRDLQTYLTVYAPNGAKVLDTTGIGNQKGEWLSKSFSVDTTGKYLFQVKSDYGASVYNFSLYHSINGGLVQDSSGERNDNKYMATPITLSQANSGVSGDVNIQRDSDTHDWYSLDLAEGEYDLNLSLLTGTEHTASFEKMDLNIYAPNGVKVVDLSKNGIAGKSYGETFTTNQSGEYLIEISNQRNAQNVYEFTINQ